MTVEHLDALNHLKMCIILSELIMEEPILTYNVNEELKFVTIPTIKHNHDLI